MTKPETEHKEYSELVTRTLERSTVIQSYASFTCAQTRHAKNKERWKKQADMCRARCSKEAARWLLTQVLLITTI